MNIKPLFNQLLIKPTAQEGVLISQEPSFLMHGEVLAVGPDCSQVKVGDIICYTLWGLNHIEIDKTKHYFVPEDKDFLLAILEAEPLPGGLVSSPSNL